MERRPPNHPVRIAAIWLLLSAIATPIVVFVWGPNLPPGTRTAQAADQQLTNTVMAGLVTPIAILILVYLVYSVVVFRRRGDEVKEGPPIRDNPRVRSAWIGANVAVVVFVVAFGTWRWIGPGVGSGSGQGSEPLARPGQEPLEVQVIGQQWAFTFRYPSYGGIETSRLAIPAGRYVEFHVTSLDVVHSFWAIDLAVKADAVPGADNVAFVKAGQVGPFQVRCAELCGLWHGQMYTTGVVLSPQRFEEWIRRQQEEHADIRKHLPPYRHVYFPDPQYRAD